MKVKRSLSRIILIIFIGLLCSCSALQFSTMVVFSKDGRYIYEKVGSRKMQALFILDTINNDYIKINNYDWTPRGWWKLYPLFGDTVWAVEEAFHMPEFRVEVFNGLKNSANYTNLYAAVEKEYDNLVNSSKEEINCTTFCKDGKNIWAIGRKKDIGREGYYSHYSRYDGEHWLTFDLASGEEIISIFSHNQTVYYICIVRSRPKEDIMALRNTTTGAITQFKINGYDASYPSYVDGYIITDYYKKKSTEEWQKSDCKNYIIERYNINNANKAMIQYEGCFGGASFMDSSDGIVTIEKQRAYYIKFQEDKENGLANADKIDNMKIADIYSSKYDIQRFSWIDPKNQIYIMQGTLLQRITDNHAEYLGEYNKFIDYALKNGIQGWK